MTDDLAPSDQGSRDHDGSEATESGPGGRTEVADQVIAKIVRGAVLSTDGNAASRSRA